MARPLITISFSDLKRKSEGFRLLINDLSKYQLEEAKKFQSKFITIARRKILPWRFTAEPGAGVYNSFVKMDPLKIKNGYKIGIENIAPHARYLEAGVKPHYLPTQTAIDEGFDLSGIKRSTRASINKITKWAKEHNMVRKNSDGQIVPIPFIQVGVKYIKLNNSKRSFMAPTMEHMISKGELDFIGMKTIEIFAKRAKKIGGRK